MVDVHLTFAVVEVDSKVDHDLAVEMAEGAGRDAGEDQWYSPTNSAQPHIPPQMK